MFSSKMDLTLSKRMSVFRKKMTKLKGYLELGAYCEGLSVNEKRDFRRMKEMYLLKDGILYYNARKREPVKVVTTDREVLDVLMQCHTSQTGCGHKGINATHEKVASRFYWKGLSADVQHFVSTCSVCQKFEKVNTQAPVLHQIKASEPLELVGIDLIGPLHLTQSGNQYILTVTDYFTKFVDLFALPCKEALGVTQCIKTFISRWGCPQRILSDQGNEFCNKINEEICKEFDIKHSITSAYHPQTNGLDERTNQTVKTQIGKFTMQHQQDWDVYLEDVALSINTQKQASTKHTPFFLMFGQEAPLPIEMEEASSNVEFAVDDSQEYVEQRTLQQKAVFKKETGDAVEVKSSDSSVHPDTNTSAAYSTTGNVFPMVLTTVVPQGRSATEDFTPSSISPEPDASLSDHAIKEEIDEQVHKGFIYLTEECLLRQWRMVGTQEKLSEDADIAQVLLSRYFGHSEEPTVEARCQLCSLPLLPTWKCQSCPGRFDPVRPVQNAAQLAEAVSAKPLRAVPVTQEKNKTSNAAIDSQNLISLDMKCEDIKEADCMPKATEVLKYPAVHQPDNTCTGLTSKAGEKETRLVSLLAPPNMKPLQDLVRFSNKTVSPVVKIHISKNPNNGDPLSISVNKNFEKQNINIPDTVFIVKKGAGNDSIKNVQEITVVKSGRQKIFHNNKSATHERLLSSKMMLPAKEKLLPESVGDNKNIISKDLASVGDMLKLCNTLSVDQLADPIDAAEPSVEQSTTDQNTAEHNEVIEKAEHLHCDENSASPCMECYRKTTAFHSYCRSPQNVVAKPNVTELRNASLSHNDMNGPTFDSKTKKQVYRVDLPEKLTLPKDYISLNVAVEGNVDTPLTHAGGMHLQSIADDDLVQPGIHLRNLPATASETHRDYDKNIAGDLSCLHEETAFNGFAVEISQSQRLATSYQSCEAQCDFDSEEVSSETSEFKKKTSAVPSMGIQCDLVGYNKRCTLIPLQCQNSPFQNPKGEAQQSKKKRTECNVCQKTFSTKSYLKYHMSAKHKEPKFVCEFCSHVCLTHRMLSTHVQIHSNERLHLCDYCGMQFKLDATLRQHIKRHQGIKSFLCKECGKSFFLKCDLKSHMLIHTKEKQHVCGVCGRAFRWFYNMRSHQKRHENASYRPQKVKSK